jgi:hypothetical protein
MRVLAGAAVFVLAISSAMAEAPRPKLLVHPIDIDKATVPQVVNSHILYLNSCRPNGCHLHPGGTDSTTDTSDIVNGNATLGAFSDGDATWGQVVQCVKDVMSPFNIEVTDVDPGSAPHFEVMIGGTPGQIGLPNGVGGIADYPCGSPGNCAKYLPNALVFDFSEVWQGDVTFICGTAAQEIAHAWTLDHATSSSDPMTYKNYASTLNFMNSAVCGSDCDYQCPGGSGVCNAFGYQCSGSGLNGTHVCMSTGAATQNEIDIITSIFGPAGAEPPTVKFKSPEIGSAQQPGFQIEVECTSDDGVQEVDLSIDGAPTAALTAAPFIFQAPGNLSDGAHHIEAMCATNLQATAVAKADFLIGQMCTADADCTMPGFICYDHACIAGPDATGGLGATCTNNADCSANSCASDGTDHFCVIPCDLHSPHCPSGFGCLEAGDNGVCWAGVDNGGGCCDSGNHGSAWGSILLSLGFGAMLVTRRKRK